MAWSRPVLPRLPGCAKAPGFRHPTPYVGGVPLPLARTPRESTWYVELHPCVCGRSQVAFRSSSDLRAEDGPVRRTEYLCPGCRQPRTFLFAVPEPPLSLSPHSYGDDRPSQLLDPGEWLWVAAFHTDVGARSGDAALWQDAAAAVDEIAKFAPPGSARVGADAIPSELGTAAYQALPAAFERDALAERARRYRRGQAVGDEAPLRRLRIKLAIDSRLGTGGRPDGLARDRLRDGLMERLKRVADPGDPSVLLSREAMLEIDALCGPNTRFDLLASYLCGSVCWYRYLWSPPGSGTDDLARALHLMTAVHDNMPRYRLPEDETLEIPEALLLIIEHRHVR